MTRPDSPNRRCSECGKSLATANPKAVTCSQLCRGARSRRLKRNRKRSEEHVRTSGARTPGAQALYELAEGELDDVTKAVIQDELRPIVREAITENTLKAISDLVGLTPAVVAAIQEDIEGYQEDGETHINYDRRQKAYALVMRYTVGHGAIVQQQDPTPPSINVHFPGMPRPETTPPPQVIEAEAVEVTEPAASELIRLMCLTCGEEKLPHEFVGQSPRCKDCHEKLQQKARDLEGSIREGVGNG